jgi:hypothetical protein
MSNPITTAIACLLSSEAGIVPSRHDDTGHAIYQVTLDGLGKATATQHWQVSPKATIRNRVSRRQPESQPTTGQHRPRMTLSSGMTLMWLRGGDEFSVVCQSLRSTAPYAQSRRE